MPGFQKINFLLLLFSIIQSLPYHRRLNTTHRPILPHLLYNISGSKHLKALKFHSKLLQTVYSDSFSKNYYYTTLYIGSHRARQTFVIDTGSSIMSSPCSPCSDCGSHKSPIYFDINRKHKPLKCSSKICKLLPATNCDEETKSTFGNTCSYTIDRASGEGISGYYMRDIVYMETDRKLHLDPLARKVFRSYALPIGCTTEELGKYKELNTDGIMGMNKSPKSFISLLYKLKVINRDIFSLCFSLRGGYMSLGEVDTTHHKSSQIQYVPLLTSRIHYLIKVTQLKVGEKGDNILQSPHFATVDTGNSISYFPPIVFKNLKKQFEDYCMERGGRCGNFTYSPEYGYCASFPLRELLFTTIIFHWPNITLHFGDSTYVWRPINYYYYRLVDGERKACLGFNYHSSDKITLGSNFIHGHDIIFDRENLRLGFVPADCSRKNLVMNRLQGILGNMPKFENTDPVLQDKALHHGELENKFSLGDNNRPDMVDFIEGHNTELDMSGFRSINIIILIISLIIVIIVVVIVIYALCCGKKLKYEEEGGEFANVNEQNETKDINNLNNNGKKIKFEETNNQVVDVGE